MDQTDQQNSDHCKHVWRTVVSARSFARSISHTDPGFVEGISDFAWGIADQGNQSLVQETEAPILAMWLSFTQGIVLHIHVDVEPVRVKERITREFDQFESVLWCVARMAVPSFCWDLSFWSIEASTEKMKFGSIYDVGSVSRMALLLSNYW